MTQLPLEKNTEKREVKDSFSCQNSNFMHIFSMFAWLFSMRRVQYDTRPYELLGIHGYIQGMVIYCYVNTATYKGW